MTLSQKYETVVQKKRRGTMRGQTEEILVNKGGSEDLGFIGLAHTE